MASSDQWSSLAVKTVVGIVAAAAIGYTVWHLAKEDEIENIKPIVKKKIGKL